MLAGLLTKLSRLRLVLIDLGEQFSVGLARLIQLTLCLFQLTCQRGAFKLLLHHELVKGVLRIVLQLTLMMLAHV